MTQTGSNGPVGTELAPRFVIHPATGEKLELNAPDVNLAVALDSIRTLEGQLKDVKSEINRELLARLDLAVTEGTNEGWTVRLPGGLTLSAPSPEPSKEYDAEALYLGLLDLVKEGLIGMEAVGRAIDVVVTYKVNRRALIALAKGNPQVTAAAQACITWVEKKRYVKVERVP